MLTLFGISLSYTTLLYLITAVVSIIVVYFYIIREPPSENDSDEESDKADSEDESLKNKPKLLILYGSQTGTAEEFAGQCATESRRYGFYGKAVDMVDYDPENLKDEKLVMFMVATYGEGEPTDNSRDFYEFLQQCEDKETMKNVQFCVFGLGNKQYKIYQAMGRYFDQRMEELGGTRVFNRGEGDADVSIEDDFEDWKSQVFPALSQKFKTETNLDDIKFEQKFDITVTPKEESDEKKLEVLSKPFEQAKKGFYDNKRPLFSEVVENYELLNSDSRSTINIEFSIKDANIFYESGDHLAVYGENKNDVIEKVLKRFRLKENQVISIKNKREDGKALFPKKSLTVGTALKYYIDLTGTVKKKLIKVFHEYYNSELGNEDEQKLLKLLAENTIEGKKKYNEYIRDSGRTPVDLLYQFKAIEIPFDVFLEAVPKLQPRYYSIGSSSKISKDKIRLIVAVLKYKTATGVEKTGFCSEFLRTLQKGKKCYIFLRQSTFHLPEDTTKPLLLIGPGTGFAPLMGFLEDRKFMKKENKKLGECVLYFGCRNKKEDYIYEKEQVEALKNGYISQHYVAFSREQKDKVYVQHKILENAQKIWAALKDGGYIFICGDAKYMAKDVDKALLDIVRQEGKMSQHKQLII